MADALEKAHLAYIRGEFAAARLSIDDVLSADPENTEALRLRTAVERESVENQAEAIRGEGWVSRLQPGVLAVLSISLVGLLCLALAVCLGIGPLQLASRLGLARRVRYPLGAVGDASSPIHFLFAGPVVLALIGGYLLWSVFVFFWGRKARGRSLNE